MPAPSSSRRMLLQLIVAVLLMLQIHQLLGLRASPSTYRYALKLRTVAPQEPFPEDYEDSVWASRRKISRAVLSPLASMALEKQQAKVVEEEGDDKQPASNELLQSFGTTPAVTTFLVAVAAVTLRLGGRGAFVSLLGLDMIADLQLKQQIDTFVASFQGLGPLQQFAAFFVAWLVAKASCIDALAIVLAFSAGILFDGLVPGTTASVICSTLASFVLFLAARYFFRERAQEQIVQRPALRAIDRACTKNGLKTVFTLRLSPLLPVPIAFYNYLYGVLNVSATDFVLGTSVASIKPYFLDCYLGLFGKSVLDDPRAETSAGDYTLLAVVALVAVVGSFATQVVADTWEEIQTEALQLRAQSHPDGSTAAEVAMTDDVGLLELFGVRDEDLPYWLRTAKQGADAAWNRIDSVITEEWRILLETSKVEAEDERGAETIVQQKRQIRDYELVPPGPENVAQYTWESIVFSFVLISAACKYADSPSLS